MKTSNKILIGIGSALVVFTLAAVLVVRLVVGSVVTVPFSAEKASFPRSGEVVTRTFDETDFNGVSASGAWDITLKQGSHYSVVVKAPQEVVNRLDVRTQGTVLHLGAMPGRTLTDRHLSAAIIMPSLDTVQLSGANRATLSGFSGSTLDVECSGAASVTGDDGSYRNLRVTASGAAMVMFRNLPTENADVDLSGAGQAELKMTGGALTGRLSGAGRLSYWGTVSSETIRTSGIGSVSHR